MTRDQITAGENSGDDSPVAGGVGSFVMQAGLAVNLAGGLPNAKSAPVEPRYLVTAEMLAQIWGDCIDE